MQNNQAKVIFGGNKVGGNLQVQGQANGGGDHHENTATGNVQVQHDAGGTLTSNEAGGNCGPQNDTPTVAGGTENTAGTGKTNTCNRSA